MQTGFESVTRKRKIVKARKPRVLLVIPNQKWVDNSFWSIHPYALCILSAVIKKFCDVAIIDANVEALKPEDVRKRVSDFKPDIVGVSVLANAYKKAAFILCDIVKSIDPDIVTVIGGVFVTTRPQNALESDAVDYGVMGEGEYVFQELIEFITGQKETLPEEGIVFRINGEIGIRPQKKYIDDLDALPMPDYSYIDYSRYSMAFRKSVESPRALPYGKIITSRGCPIGCVFCQVEKISGKKTRCKSASKVIEEIQHLIDNYGIKAIEFEDDNFLGNSKRSKELFKLMAQNNWDLVWNAMNLSVFYLNEEMLDLMKASKCVYLSMAIESGSPRVLKDIIHKPVNLDHAIKMAAYARKIGIDTTALFVIGFPGETRKEIEQTIAFAEEIGADYVKFNVATAFPGTKLHDLARRTGAIDPNFDYDSIQWGQAGISTDEFTAAALTRLRVIEWNRINFSNEAKKKKIAQMMGISIDELERVRKKTLEGI